MLLRTLLLWLHSASVITWFGGLLFYVAVAAPAARAAGSALERMRAVRDLDQRFRHVVWGSVEAAVVTGIALLVITMFQAGSGMRLGPGYERVLAAKLFLAVLIIGMQLYNHLRVNPRKAALAEVALGGGSGEAGAPGGARAMGRGEPGAGVAGGARAMGAGTAAAPASAEVAGAFEVLQARTQQIFALELVVAMAVVLLGVHLRAVL